jgi:hypothetical protein
MRKNSYCIYTGVAMNTLGLKGSESLAAFPFGHNITKANNSGIIITKHIGFSRLKIFKSLTQQQQLELNIFSQ